MSDARVVGEIRPAAPGDGSVLPDAAATERAGRAFGDALEAVLGPLRAAGADGRAVANGGAVFNGGAVVIGLAGGLGAGKTMLARAALRALGVDGTVRSPTYTIAEPYETRIGRIWHLDLYRIADPEELEYVAIRDLVTESVACLVEWPERGAGALPALDCRLTIAPSGHGRRLRMEWSTGRGRAIGLRALAPPSRRPIGDMGAGVKPGSS